MHNKKARPGGIRLRLNMVKYSADFVKYLDMGKYKLIDHMGHSVLIV